MQECSLQVGHHRMWTFSKEMSELEARRKRWSFWCPTKEKKFLVLTTISIRSVRQVHSSNQVGVSHLPQKVEKKPGEKSGKKSGKSREKIQEKSWEKSWEKSREKSREKIWEESREKNSGRKSGKKSEKIEKLQRKKSGKKSRKKSGKKTERVQNLRGYSKLKV